VRCGGAAGFPPGVSVALQSILRDDLNVDTHNAGRSQLWATTPFEKGWLWADTFQAAGCQRPEVSCKGPRLLARKRFAFESTGITQPGLDGQRDRRPFGGDPVDGAPVSVREFPHIGRDPGRAGPDAPMPAIT
jgi:hypothetical protein